MASKSRSTQTHKAAMAKSASNMIKQKIATNYQTPNYFTKFNNESPALSGISIITEITKKLKIPGMYFWVIKHTGDERTNPLSDQFAWLTRYGETVEKSILTLNYVDTNEYSKPAQTFTIFQRRGVALHSVEETEEIQLSDPSLLTKIQAHVDLAVTKWSYLKK